MFVRKKILIVDGMEMSRHFLRHTLTNAGYVVETASNEDDAMTMANNQDFDVFIIDLHLPDMASIKVIKSLRGIEDYLTTPILAATNANIESLRAKGDELGITTWLKKPISSRDLLDLLKEMKLVNTQNIQSLV